MMRSIKSILSTDRERYKVPRKVQDVIPIRRIWPDGIFLVGNKFAKSWKFTDISYLVASREDKERMFLAYSELFNSLDSGATTKITVYNHHLKRSDFEDSILMPLKADGLDEYREEYNKMLLDKSVDANGILQEKYVTVTVAKKNIEEARAYFARVGADLVQHFAALGSRCTELTALERLRILHDFYRSGEENAFPFDLKDNMRKGHCFRDYICPDSIEKHADYLKLGERYARVLYEGHKSIHFDSLSAFGEYEVVAAFRFNTNRDTFRYNEYTNMDEAEFAEFLENVRARALYDTGVEVEYGDELLILSTCEYTYKNGRFVVVAKKVG